MFTTLALSFFSAFTSKLQIWCSFTSKYFSIYFLKTKTFSYITAVKLNQEAYIAIITLPYSDCLIIFFKAEEKHIACRWHGAISSFSLERFHSFPLSFVTNTLEEYSLGLC